MKSASQVPQSSWCSCVESSGISCELHSSLWWPSAAQMAQEKKYSPYSPGRLVRVRSLSWKPPVWHIIHQARWGGGNTFPPRPSLQTPHQIMQLYKSQLCSLRGCSARMAKTLRRRAGHITPTSSSTRSAAHYLGASCCQHVLKPCSACQKKNWANLFNVSKDQGEKKIVKKRKDWIWELYSSESW